MSIRIGDLGVSEASVLGAILPPAFRFDVEEKETKKSENISENCPDPTAILARSHNLPVALTWLLLRLDCPITKMLTATLPEVLTIRDETYMIAKSVTSLRPAASLARARNTLRLSDDAFADGLLAGADRLSEATLKDAERLFLGEGGERGGGILYDPTAGTTPSWPVLQPCQPLPPPPQQFPSRLPPLPPGVMATLPPAGLGPEQLSVSTSKPIDEAFSSSVSTSSMSNFAHLYFPSLHLITNI